MHTLPLMTVNILYVRVGNGRVPLLRRRILSVSIPKLANHGKECVGRSNLLVASRSKVDHTGRLVASHVDTDEFGFNALFLTNVFDATENVLFVQRFPIAQYCQWLAHVLRWDQYRRIDIVCKPRVVCRDGLVVNRVGL